MAINLLNMKPHPGRERIAEIVESCHRVAQLMESIKLSSASDHQQNVEVNNAILKLNGQLLKYEWKPYVLGSMAADSHFKVLFAMQASSNDPPVVAMEQFAIQWIVDHISEVNRVRRCRLLKCRKWFFAKTDHQKYCGDNCRQRDAAQGESFKEKRRIYMKKYRREEAARDKRSKQFS